MDGFNYKELDELNRELLQIANETMPKEAKAFMRKEGSKVAKQTKSGLRTAYKVRTGKLVRGVKRGKAYLRKQDNAYQIRVHMAPKGDIVDIKTGKTKKTYENVVDYGHRTPSGKVVKGKRIKDKVEAFFSEEFEEDVLDFIDDLLDKGLS